MPPRSGRRRPPGPGSRTPPARALSTNSRWFGRAISPRAMVAITRPGSRTDTIDTASASLCDSHIWLPSGESFRNGVNAGLSWAARSTVRSRSGRSGRGIRVDREGPAWRPLADDEGEGAVLREPDLGRAFDRRHRCAYRVHRSAARLPARQLDVEDGDAVLAADRDPGGAAVAGEGGLVRLTADQNAARQPLRVGRRAGQRIGQVAEHLAIDRVDQVDVAASPSGRREQGAVRIRHRAGGYAAVVQGLVDHRRMRWHHAAGDIAERRRASSSKLVRLMVVSTRLLAGSITLIVLESSLVMKTRSCGAMSAGLAAAGAVAGACAKAQGAAADAGRAAASFRKSLRLSWSSFMRVSGDRSRQ